MNVSQNPLITISTPITKNVITECNYEYFGFNCYVNELILNVSVELEVNIAYLLNGELDSTNYLNDGKYSYMKKYIILSGIDYSNWSNDDSYIINWVSNNIQYIINSDLNNPSNIYNGHTINRI